LAQQYFEPSMSLNLIAALFCVNYIVEKFKRRAALDKSWDKNKRNQKL